MSETRRSGHSKLVYDKTKQTIVAVDEGSLPWDDCKVAFGIEDSEAFERCGLMYQRHHGQKAGAL